MQKSLEILVVDHDRDVAEGLADVLELAGHKVHLAFASDKAADLFRQYDFDICFVNVKLPGMSGIESFMEFCKLKPKAEVIMMTGHTVDQLAAQAADGSPVKVLRTPITVDSVVKALGDVSPTGIVLVDEASPEFCAELQQTLLRLDTLFLQADSQSLALDAIPSGGYEVLVFDIEVPMIRGLETYLNLKRQGCCLPTIVFNRLAKTETHVSTARDDFSETGVFFKPFDPAQMLKTLEQVSKAKGPRPANSPVPEETLPEAVPPSPSQPQAAWPAPAVETETPPIPAMEPLAVEPPLTEAPVVETHGAETHGAETPVFEAPVDETPVFDAPVVESSAVEAPAAEPMIEHDAMSNAGGAGQWIGRTDEGDGDVGHGEPDANPSCEQDSAWSTSEPAQHAAPQPAAPVPDEIHEPDVMLGGPSSQGDLSETAAAPEKPDNEVFAEGSAEGGMDAHPTSEPVWGGESAQRDDPVGIATDQPTETADPVPAPQLDSIQTQNDAPAPVPQGAEWAPDLGETAPPSEFEPIPHETPQDYPAESRIDEFAFTDSRNDGMEPEMPSKDKAEDPGSFAHLPPLPDPDQVLGVEQPDGGSHDPEQAPASEPLAESDGTWNPDTLSDMPSRDADVPSSEAEPDVAPALMEGWPEVPTQDPVLDQEDNEEDAVVLGGTDSIPRIAMPFDPAPEELFDWTKVDPQSVSEAAEPPKPVEPVSVQPEPIEPETIEPETIEPELVEPELVEPEPAEPETVEPETVEPETLESSSPEQPDTSPGSQGDESPIATPAVPSGHVEQDQPATYDASFEGKTRVLVIDDDRDMAQGLAEILQDSGLTVEVAHSTEQAIEAISTFEAQIALIDIQLGRNSGLDLISELRARRPNIIPIMVTAQTDQKSAIEALREGAFDYLNKPLHPQELLAALDRCFDRMRKEPVPAMEGGPSDDGSGPDGEPSPEFLANLSHKLRTPLNAVVGFSEIMSEQMLGPLGSDQYRHYAEDINQAGKLLKSAIDDFTSIDKSAAGKVELHEEQVDLSRVIFECLTRIQPAVDAGNLTIDINVAEIPVFLEGDSHKLSQVLLSLLTNAIKFTPQQGHIGFNLSRDLTGDLIIQVRDTGVGIAEEQIAKALATVIEGDGDLDPGYEGSGLGLPLANSMVELHGGKLTLDSQVGVGTVATVRLPASRNVAPPHAQAV